MNLIERVKNILTTPKTEWEFINGESASPQSLLMGYILPLAVVSAIGPVLSGLLFAGIFGFKYFIVTAIVGFISQIVAYYITVILVDLLAPSFGSEKDPNKSAQLVAYSYTPSFIAGVLSFIPFLGALIGLAAWAYGVYIMYLGMEPLKKTPEDKKVVYLVVVYVILIAGFFIITAILTGILFAVLGIGAASLGSRSLF
jgi:hypothetical protein